MSNPDPSLKLLHQPFLIVIKQFNHICDTTFLYI